jgi:hypothetical protein
MQNPERMGEHTTRVELSQHIPAISVNGSKLGSLRTEGLYKGRVSTGSAAYFFDI